MTDKDKVLIADLRKADGGAVLDRAADRLEELVKNEPPTTTLLDQSRRIVELLAKVKDRDQEIANLKKRAESAERDLDELREDYTEMVAAFDELRAAASNLMTAVEGDRRGFLEALASLRAVLRPSPCTAESWPHLLARVLYVPGVLAAVSKCEWEAVAFAESIWSCVPGAWPSWSKAP